MTDSPRFTIVAATDNFLTVYQKKEADILKKDFFEIFGNSDIEAPNNNSTDLLALFSTTIKNKVQCKFEQFYLSQKKRPVSFRSKICRCGNYPCFKRK